MGDLEFIRAHVKNWPPNAETVRLDYDGELCFKPTKVMADFYPQGFRTSMFIGNTEVYGSGALTGVNYTRDEWQPYLDPIEAKLHEQWVEFNAKMQHIKEE